MTRVDPVEVLRRFPPLPDIMDVLRLVESNSRDSVQRGSTSAVEVDPRAAFYAAALSGRLVPR